MPLSARRGSNEAGRLLVIPFAPGIGDMVMMEPVMRAIRSRLSDWQVTMVAKEYAADILQPEGYDLVSPSYFVSQTPAPLRPLDRLIPRKLIAWAAEPAFVLDLGPFRRVINLFWVWESQAPFQRWWTPQWPPQRDVVHTLDLLLDYLETELGSPIPGHERMPRLDPYPEAREWADRYLHEQLGDGADAVVSLVVSSANPLKWWSTSAWADLNRRLHGKGLRPVLVAPHDQEHAEQVYAACDPKLPWPAPNLRQVAALLHRSRAVVGIDTGPLHFAAALGTPWVGIFGATNPDFIGPYDRTLGRALLAPFPKTEACRACWLAFKNHAAECAALPLTGCTVMVPVDEVEAALDAVLLGTGIASSES